MLRSVSVRTRSQDVIGWLGLWIVNLLGFVAVVQAAEPAVEAPRPSPTARRIIAAEPVSFTAVNSPIASVLMERALGKSDFTIGVSVQLNDAETHDPGDVISVWNAKTRHGFSIGVRNNTGVTSSQSNWRQLQFGIDAGTEPAWRDEGRPGTAILGFATTVHDGHLYVSTCEPADPQGAQVYRYVGPDRWEPLGRLDGSNSVTALASYNGHLYAGTGKYRLKGSALTESENEKLGGKIYRFVKPGEWELVGDLAPVEAIAAMVTFGGKLYASSLYQPAGFFRYDGDRQWTAIPTPDDKRVEPLGVYQGAIYAGSYDGGSVYRFDGNRWKNLGLVAPDITQNYAFATYQGQLYVGTWPTGKVYRLGDNDRWIDCGRLGEEQEVMAMLVHNGVFYSGSLPKAEVYRYEGETRWTRLKQIDETPDVKYRRVWTMATFQGRLFATTLPSGKIWSMSAGRMVTHDRELGSGWQHVVAQRIAGQLRLFVNGKLVAQGEDGALDLATAGLELQIGNGPRGKFSGAMKDVWFDVTP